MIKSGEQGEYMAAGEQYPGWYSRVDAPDGAGKTTLINFARAYDAEHNLNTLFIREPGTGAFGEQMRNLLLHASEYDFSPQTEYALLTANRSHLASDLIIPALQEGRGVISDRGIESSTMQGGRAGEITAALKGASKSMTIDEIFEIGELFLPEIYMRPNGLVLLALSKEVRRARMATKASTLGLDKIEQRTMEYSDAVHDGYIDLETRLPHATIISAEQTQEEVWEQARPILFGPDHA